MKERPIPFSAPMVRALLAGTKTQTRRLVKDLPPTTMWPGIRCPYGAPGDRLWVREAWRPLSRHPAPTMETAPMVDFGREVPTYQVQRGCAYRADGAIVWADYIETIYDGSGRPPKEAKRHVATAIDPIKWRPSIHMPRRLSRLTLDLTDVRAQRLQDISEVDARAEGVEPDFGNAHTHAGNDYRRSYARLWDEINGDGSWGANPWVWALTFEVVR